MHLPPVPTYASLPSIMYGDQGLVFDLAVSPHYVLWMPYLILYRLSDASLSDQWPPSPFILHVFSSTTGRWEEKSFIGKATPPWPPWLMVPYYCKTHSVYLWGVLYMHCQNDCVIKIKLPGDFASNKKTSDPFLGKPKDRVCYVLVTDPRRLQIWFLNETKSSSSYSSSSSSYEWVLKHDVDLGPIIQSYPCNHGCQQWIWHNADTKQDKDRELPAVNDVEEFEWAIDKDSNDDVDNISGASESIHHNGQCVSVVLGFHPLRDIVFLYDT
uniref:F-box associated domain-containing protein n=1 Tax=Oryza meridionalis TaxID=40149 RepID=A0A0E0FES1_9ORYZ